MATSSSSTSRPVTRDGSIPAPPNNEPPPIPTGPAAAANTSGKDRKSSFSRKTSSFTSRRRGSSSATLHSSNGIVTNADAPPALPDYAIAAAAKILPWDRDRPGTSVGARGATPSDAEGLRSPTSPDRIGRSLTESTMITSTFSIPATMQNGAILAGGPGGTLQYSEATYLHSQISEVANKRISTLDYLRKSHEGRIYWFNTYLFDKPDLHRMPYFDHRKLARKATNLLLLGLSLPIVSELYASTPVEFLRTLNVLFSEFETFQQLHSENSSNRPRLQNMFRNRTSRARRSTTSGSDAFLDEQSAVGSPPVGTSHNVINFAASESDLHPGEEYSFLLTPSLPFDPDYYETFATLCDVLIEAYTKFLSFMAVPRDCTPTVADLFHKVDAKVRKLIVQGVVKEFEEHSKAHTKTEVANIGKVVLGGLM